MAKIFCRGTHTNCECPHCGKNNVYVCQGVIVEFGKVKCFSKPCFYCKKMIYYQANYEIAVVAEKTDPLNPGLSTDGA